MVEHRNKVNVIGRKITLSDGRIVFLGQCEENKEHWHIAFRSNEGTDTYLVLSDEAMTALMALFANPGVNGEGPCDFPHRHVWQRVALDATDIEEKK
jgi:hypothetical protein